jgi:hypothetical protein
MHSKHTNGSVDTLMLNFSTGNKTVIYYVTDIQGLCLKRQNTTSNFRTN